jgi:hypothetical protein
MAGRHCDAVRRVRSSTIVTDILPFYASLIALIGAALVLDALLHYFGATWIGRYLGLPGVLLIIASFGHSLRKRKIISTGHPLLFMRLHEWLAWVGSLLVLIHAGIHFNGILAWLAVLAMLTNMTSGLTGKYLLQRVQRSLIEQRAGLHDRGATDAEIEERLYWDSLAFDLVRRWRKVHVGVAMTFGVLATAHIVAVCVFWGWR